MARITVNQTKKGALARSTESDLKRADEILVQQHVIRRFMSHQGIDFQNLHVMRLEIDALLREAGLKTVPGLFEGSRISTLACCMNFVGDRRNLERLANGEHSSFMHGLCAELDEHFDQSSTMAPPLLDEDIEAVAKVLIAYAPVVADIDRRLNYLRYYSLFGITNYVHGRTLYEHYMKPLWGIHKIRNAPAALEARPDEAMWLHTAESQADEHLSAIVATSAHRPLRTSRNVQIFGGRQHDISISGTPLEHRLVLSVPTNETPDNIDEALRQFREALIQEFIDNTGAYWRVSDDRFDRSAFMTVFARDTCLVQAWDQIKKWLVGLWVWDAHKLEGRTVSDAGKHVMNEQGTFKSPPATRSHLYAEGTIEVCYDNVASEIGPAPTQKRKKALARRIDRFVTRSDTALGPITGSST